MFEVGLWTHLDFRLKGIITLGGVQIREYYHSSSVRSAFGLLSRALVMGLASNEPLFELHPCNLHHFVVHKTQFQKSNEIH